LEPAVRLGSGNAVRERQPVKCALAAKPPGGSEARRARD